MVYQEIHSALLGKEQHAQAVAPPEPWVRALWFLDKDIKKGSLYLKLWLIFTHKKLQEIWVSMQPVFIISRAPNPPGLQLELVLFHFCPINIQGNESTCERIQQVKSEELNWSVLI